MSWANETLGQVLRRPYVALIAAALLALSVMMGLPLFVAIVFAVILGLYAMGSWYTERRS